MGTLYQRTLAQHMSTVSLSIDRVTARWDTVDVVTRLSMVLLLLYSGNEWYYRVPIALMCVAALLNQRLFSSANFWFFVTVFLASGNYYNWYTIDNHRYLIMYWCFGLCCAFSTADPRRAVALNARLLIGLCFLFAVVWKVAAGQYADGSFMHFTMLADERFRNVAEFFGGIDSQKFTYNQTALTHLVGGERGLQSVTLMDTPQLRQVALIVSWWTILIEGLVALAFLWPGERGLARFRDALLLVFLVTTYAVATVVGFGWVLVIMGIAQLPQRSRHLLFFYIMAFFVLQIYLTPLGTIFRQGFGMTFPF
jgi:hypothetical protein